MDFKDRLQLLRKTMGYKTKKSLAEFINITYTYYARLENGDHKQPGMVIINKIIDKTGVNYSWLAGGEGEMFTKKKYEIQNNSKSLVRERTIGNLKLFEIIEILSGDPDLTEKIHNLLKTFIDRTK